jgi:hypothetical protein
MTDILETTDDEKEEIRRQDELAKRIQKWSEIHDCIEANCRFNPNGEKIRPDKSNAQRRGPRPQ